MIIGNYKENSEVLYSCLLYIKSKAHIYDCKYSKLFTANKNNLIK